MHADVARREGCASDCWPVLLLCMDIPVVTDSILHDSYRALQRCDGLAGLSILYQVNWPIYVHMGQFIYVYVCIHIMLVYDMYTYIHIHTCVYMYTYHVGI